MKLVRMNVEKHGKGTVELVPEEKEDMWHLYNLIIVGDNVQASTMRKVQNQTAGSVLTFRARTTLTINVENVDFDTQVCVLRLNGKNIVENEYVKMGAYHTLTLELNRKFLLYKNEWDSVALDRIKTSCNPAKNCDAAAVIMQEGLAHICLINDCMTIVRAKIDINIPKKRKGSTKQYEQGLQRFYNTVMQGLIRHVDFDVVKVVLIASPGFVRDKFFEYMMNEAVKNDLKVLLENKSKFLLVHSSSGYKHSLKEILTTPAVMSRMADTKALAEVKALELFYQILMSDPDKAFYGVKHVQKANERQAIETLLISDKLFRCDDVKERKRFVQLVDSVRNYGGDVKIFSSMHVSGEQLQNLTGIAAILRFPIPDIDENDGDDNVL